MKAVRAVLDFLVNGDVKYIFGIPAGSVNALYDELYDMPHITPIITKHEGAASYMAASYAKYSNQLGVCIGCSGPGSTNLLSGAANAMREHLPVLFLTGSVPVRTMGLNASQELDVQPLFEPITKYSVTVNRAEDLLEEVVKAVDLALSGIPGPVHVAIPIDVQLEEISVPLLPHFPTREIILPDSLQIEQVARTLNEHEKGIIFLGQGSREAVYESIKLAEKLNWPIITTPQAKGYIPSSHPLFCGVFGFAGHESASTLINNKDVDAILIIGSSLGETATSNWNTALTDHRFVVQIDIDPSVFNRKYQVDQAIVGDATESVKMIHSVLTNLGVNRSYDFIGEHQETPPYSTTDFNTQNTLLSLQEKLPTSTRYTIDIGEFMSYVIHYMPVQDFHSFEINVHFGAMGYGISSAIGAHLADPTRQIVCITGDGCFFMHGMEILTAREYNLPILFVIMNNARLGMVYHGHSLQYKRSHPRFEQHPVNIAKLATELNIPTTRIEHIKELTSDVVKQLIRSDGPSILEISLVDNNVPPMGDRVKFLSSFQK